MTKTTILGAGAWGTALGCAMIRAGHDVIIWGRNSNTVDQINQQHRNPDFLGDIALEPSLTATDDLQRATHGADLILFVIPAQSISMMVEDLRGQINEKQILITCAKGIDHASGKTPAELLSGLTSPDKIGALSGPSFAHDVASGLPTAVTLAFNDMDKARENAAKMSSEKFRIYASDDLVGVELGGALKNVLALAVGVARGMELGASAQAALIARGFGELRRLAVAMGAREETLLGLSGLGDLVLTASSTQSRNFSYGMAMGRGESLDNLPLAEGALSAQISATLAKKHAIDVPIIQSIGAVVAGEITAQKAVQKLLSRPLKAESE